MNPIDLKPIDFVVAIPARHAASRLPGKPLRLLGGITALLGVLGAIVHAQLLQDTDPHAWSVVRYRMAEIPGELRARLFGLQNTLRPHADAT